jgi:hypothetical protein
MIQYPERLSPTSKAATIASAQGRNARGSDGRRARFCRCGLVTERGARAGSFRCGVDRGDLICRDPLVTDSARSLRSPCSAGALLTFTVLPPHGRYAASPLLIKLAGRAEMSAPDRACGGAVRSRDVGRRHHAGRTLLVSAARRRYRHGLDGECLGSRPPLRGWVRVEFWAIEKMFKTRSLIATLARMNPMLLLMQ